MFIFGRYMHTPYSELSYSRSLSHYSVTNPFDALHFLVGFLILIDLQELNVPEKDVEDLLVSLILDNRIDGHIDQVNRLLERGDRSINNLDVPLLIYLLRPKFTSNVFYTMYSCTQIKRDEEVYCHR